MIRNEKGVIALAVILSMLMVIGSLAVFGFVSGRLGTTYRLHRRPQAILDAESASYVAYMMIREGDWSIDHFRKCVRFLNPDGNIRKDIEIRTDTDIDSGRNRIKSESGY
jgi:hypothetical protein